MVRMRRRTHIGKALLRIAALVFFVNTATAYGACCFEVPQSSDTDAVVEMPCHQNDDESNDSSDADDCCVLCLSMMASLDAGIASIHGAAITTTTTPTSITTGIDPPFRPPISLLS